MKIGAALDVVELVFTIFGALASLHELMAARRRMLARKAAQLTRKQEREAHDLVRHVIEESKVVNAVVIVYPRRGRWPSFDDPHFQKYVVEFLEQGFHDRFREFGFSAPDWLDSEWSFTAYLKS